MHPFSNPTGDVSQVDISGCRRANESIRSIEIVDHQIDAVELEERRGDKPREALVASNGLGLRLLTADDERRKMLP